MVLYNYNFMQLGQTKWQVVSIEKTRTDINTADILHCAQLRLSDHKLQKLNSRLEYRRIKTFFIGLERMTKVHG